MQNLFLKGFCIFLTISCTYVPSEKSNYEFDDKITLEVFDKIEFKIDENTGLTLQSLQYFYDTVNQSEYLFFLNPYNNGLYRYSFSERQNPKIVRFPIEGPNGVGKLSGFYVHNLDSIFILANQNYQVALVKDLYSDKKRDFQKYRLINRTTVEQSAKPLGYTGNRMLLLGQNLYILGIPDLEATDPDYFQKAKNLQVLNLLDSSVTFTNLYSKDYHGHVWPIPFRFYYHDIMAEKKQIIISSPLSDSLIVYDDGIKSKVYAGSKYVGEIPGLTTSEYYSDKRDFHYYSHASYYYVLIDSFRQFIYRFVELPFETAIADNDPRMQNKVPSIIVLDTTMQKVGEIVLPPVEYFPFMSFVGKDGLYISQPVLNLTKTNIKENVLGFTLFQSREKPVID